MKERILLILFSMLFFWYSTASAVEVRAIWDPNPPEEQIDGYTVWERVAEDPGMVEVLSVPATETAAQWEITGDLSNCRTYFLTAYRGDEHSPPSDPAAWCPEVTLPDMILRPGQAINLRIEVVE